MELHGISRYNDRPVTNGAEWVWMSMEANQRIEELERQVKELTHMVRALVTERHPSAEPKKAQSREPQRHTLPHDMHRNVDRILGGEAGDTLETRIGGIWLSRVTMVLLMTAIVLGARVTLYSEVMGPVQKLVLVYAASIGAIVYGIGWRNSPSLFPQTLLGAGLAGVYFATYAAFFVEGMQVASSHTLAFPLLFACLVLLVGVAHWRRSQTVAGISIFLVYYTVVASCMGGHSSENVYYALGTIAMLAVAALWFHAAHRWMLFTWAALIATHGVYLYFFLAKPAGLDMPAREYFWVANGFLTVCYAMFSCACILDARKTGEYRRGVAPMSGTNSFIFLVLVWISVRQNYVEYEWLFRLGLATGMLGFAMLAETFGPRRNYLFQIYMAKTVVMFTLALQAYLSGEMLMVAMAIECLAMAFSYKRSGTVIFKAMGLVLLAIAFVGCLAHVKTPGGIMLAGVLLRANWFCCAGSAVALIFVSWYYEHFVRPVLPEHRTVRGQWFLAESFLDVRSPTAAMLHSAAAALILLTITILDRSSAPELPYVLAAEGVAMGVAGFVLRTPQVEIGGVLLLVASHVCYHVFLAMGIPGFEQQPNYALYTVLVALFTYLGAYFWERYLRRFQGGRPWEHDVVAALPYLAATFMLTTLVARRFAGMPAPLVQNALGIVLLLVGVLTRYPGVKASGFLALGIGACSVYMGFYVSHESFVQDPNFLFYFPLILASYVVGERLFVVLQRQERLPSKIEDVLRSALVGVAAVMGVFGFSLYARPEYLTLHWLALATCGVAFGALFGESRYRWAALALFAVAIVRAYAVDLRKMQPVYQFLSFAGLSLSLLVISWVYSRYRQSALKRSSDEAGQDTASHG